MSNDSSSASSVNHNKPLNERFAHLLGNPEHADFWFQIDEEDGSAAGVTRRRIPVHKLIVGPCSQVLHNIVYGANSEFVVAVDHSQVHDISVAAFMEVLRYMYTDQPVITDDNVVAVFRTAIFFGLGNLEQMSAEHMADNIRMESCLLVFAGVYNFIRFDHIAKKCLHFIGMQPQLAAFDRVDWTKLNRDVVQHILSSDFISCDEYTLFAALLKWLRAHRDQSELPSTTGFKAIANGLENCIRWTTLTIPEFERVISLEPEFFSKDEKNELLRAIQGGTSTQIKRRTLFWKHSRWVRLTDANTPLPSDASCLPMHFYMPSYLARDKMHKIRTYLLESDVEDEDDGNEMLEVLCGSGYKWVSLQNRNLPDNMVPTSLVEKDTVVAKVSEDFVFELNVSNFMFGNRSGLDSEDYDPFLEVLVGTYIESELLPREIPADAVIASTPNGPHPSVTYLGRVYLGRDVLPAVIYPAEERATTSNAGSEHHLNSFTFLRLQQGSFEWIQSSNGRREPSAVYEGRKELYFGRTMHLGRMQYGKVDPLHKCMYFGFNGAELSSRNYEVLVHK